MRKLSLILMILVAALLMTSCSEDRGVEPQTTGNTIAGIDPEMLAGELIMASGWEFDPEVELPAKLALLEDKGARCRILDFEREVLVGDIVHYSFIVQVGDGMHDKIKLHRVVKEQRPYRPIRTKRNIFLQHGDAVGFVKFLFGAATPSAPDDHAVAIYLAQNRVDVWGIDQNWVLVPEDTSDFSFMEDWGLQNQIENLRTGIAMARFVRLFSSSNFNKMHLLGYSSGAMTGFAYLNDEAARPECERHVKGFVNADMFYKFGPDDQAGREVLCADVVYYEEVMGNGEYGTWVGFYDVGYNALVDPDGDSPWGITNLQMALMFGSATWRLWPVTPGWHYWGGYFDGDPQDDSSMPTDTRFLPLDYALEFMTTAAPWEATQFQLDYSLILCDETDVPWDDNLGDVTVPILNFGGAGGFAPLADYTFGLLGSTDVQHVVLSELPPEQRYEDWGHIDIWTATDAPTMAWQPLLHWIRTHNGNK